MAANFSATEIELLAPSLLTAIPFDMSDIIISLGVIGPLAAIIAIVFMKLVLFLELYLQK